MDKSTPRNRHLNTTKAGSINQAIEQTHLAIHEQIPEVVRMAFASYDSTHGQLRTFAHSTLQGTPLLHYSAPISAQSRLGKTVTRQLTRVVNDIPTEIANDSQHSKWLLEQGYEASFTRPVFDNGEFIGLLFFDADRKGFFDSSTTSELIKDSDNLVRQICEQRQCVNAMSDLGFSLRRTNFEHQNESLDHAYRVGQYTRLIGEKVAELYQLNDETIEHMVQFAELHDVGKYSNLGTKQQSLWLEDWGDHLKLTAQIQQGLNLINALARQIHEEQQTCVQLLREIIQYHHEYLDGSGAPRGLSHAHIPVSARIVTVANIFDALTSHRSYSESWSLTHALLELEKMVTLGKIDGNCVQALRAQQDVVKLVMQSNFLPRH